MGRPSKLTDSLAERICEAVALTTKGLPTICELNEDFPAYETIIRWTVRDEAFRHKYAHAKEQQMQLIGCEILEIADEMPTCTVPDPDGGVSVRIDNAGIQRNRLRVDTRKWLMSKLAPKTYGDKVQQEVTGANGGPIQASVLVEFVKTGQSEQG